MIQRPVKKVVKCTKCWVTGRDGPAALVRKLELECGHVMIFRTVQHHGIDPQQVQCIDCPYKVELDP